MIKNLNLVSLKLKSNLFTILIAITVYICWYYCGLDKLALSSAYLNISLGHIGYTGLLLLPAFLILEKRKLQQLWVFFSSLTLLDLINMIYLTNGKTDSIPYSSYANSLFISILIILFFIAVFFSITSAYKIDKKNMKKNLLYIIFFICFTILFYHISNIWLYSQGVTNKDRSIFINNLEIHHIDYGVILLIFVPFLFKYFAKYSKKLYFFINAFIGFIYGTVFDECFYYMNVYKSEEQFDKLYLNSIPVIVISAIIMAISLASWFYFLKKEKRITLVSKLQL